MLSDKISATAGPINSGHAVQYGYDVNGIPAIQVKLYDDDPDSGLTMDGGHTSQHRDPKFLRSLAISLLEGADQLELMREQAKREAAGS